MKSCISTRLHPQGKGGPQSILCGQCLKTWTKNENTTTMYNPDPKIVSFRKIDHFPVVDFLVEKVCFWQVACCRSSVCFCKTDRSVDFKWSRMPWLCHPKIVSRALLHSDKHLKKHSVRRRRVTDGRTFLSVAHTKCPSGNNYDKSDRRIRGTVVYLHIYPPAYIPIDVFFENFVAKFSI